MSFATLPLRGPSGPGAGEVRVEDGMLIVDAPDWLAKPLTQSLHSVRMIEPGRKIPVDRAQLDIRYLHTADQQEDGQQLKLIFLDAAPVAWTRFAGPAPPVRSANSPVWPRPVEYPSRIDGVVVDVDSISQDFLESVDILSSREEHAFTHRRTHNHMTWAGVLQGVGTLGFGVSFVGFLASGTLVWLDVVEGPAGERAVLLSALGLFVFRLLWRLGDRLVSGPRVC